MWPFFERNKQKQTGASNTTPNDPESIGSMPRRPPMRFAELVKGMGDFSDFRQHDTAMKFWLPEAANEALNEMADRSGISMSESLRQLFTAHCYGIYAYQVMIETIPGIFRDPARPMFSRGVTEPPTGKKRVDTYWVPELGKKVKPIKVWIPKRMRHDLQLLAEHVGINLSQYVREIIIARLFGHGTLPMRPEMLEAEPLPAIEAWCEDKEIELRLATYEEYLDYPLGERRAEWVDE